METREGRYAASNAGFAHRPGLMRLQPLTAIALEEDPSNCGPTGAQTIKLPDTLFCQDDMSPLSALACPNMHGPGIRVEVGNPKIGEFAVASTGCQGRAD